MRTSLLSNYLPDFLVTPRGCASATLVAIALLAGCGGVEPPHGPGPTPPPPPPPPAPQCVPDGSVAGSDLACCSVQRNAGGLCCTGSACAPPKPNLFVQSFSVQITAPTSPTGTLYLCLNRQPDGTRTNYRNSIVVKNAGNANAGTYKVALGIVSERDPSKNFYCSDKLTDSTGLLPGTTGTWEGPYCCSFGVSTVPTGNYFGAVDVDFDNEVTESDETDNVNKSVAASVYIP